MKTYSPSTPAARSAPAPCTSTSKIAILPCRCVHVSGHIRFAPSTFWVSVALAEARHVIHTIPSQTVRRKSAKVPVHGTW